MEGRALFPCTLRHKFQVRLALWRVVERLEWEQ
jgi:hypothetical protein